MPINSDSGVGAAPGGRPSLKLCMQPKSYTHRLYWHLERPARSVSAFLSYPDGMGPNNQYFWEAYIDGDAERWFGPNAEEEMEQVILNALVREPAPNQPAAAADGGTKQKKENPDD